MEKIANLKKRHAFAGWPMIIFWVGMVIFAAHACTRMVAAGDTWVALACGRHFVDHGVDTVEPFSANSHKAGPTEAELEKFPKWLRSTVKKMHPAGWVNQNWLTHVIFYWLVDTFRTGDSDYNYNMLVYWKFAVYMISVIVVYHIGRLLKVTPALSAVSAACAMYVGRTFLDVRPAGFSNMLVAIYFLILVLTIYKNIRYIWLMVPLVVFWSNVHGGYIYAFIMFVPFVGLNFLASFSKNRFVSIGKKGLYHSIAAGIVMLIAAIVFNPFHLTNFTHTFIISLSEHAESWRLVYEWHPAFEWDNPVGDEEGFLVMYIISWVVLAFWIISRFLKPGIAGRRAKQQRQTNSADDYQWPKIDLTIIIISALTVYMAIRSRRFIPIAGFVACPVIAMLIQQAVCMISARVRFKKDGWLIVSAMPAYLRNIFITIALVAVAGFGGFFGAKFKRVYLDPWPNDGVRDSIFMRMTASHLKPFEACQFIRENNLSGNMFNHWTEGGAIAFGQQPDKETGKTPLQLFMDGRAQAAYDHKIFQLWNYIRKGGPVFTNATLAKRKLTTADYIEIGKWGDSKMKEHDVWLVMMPAGEINIPFINGLVRSPNSNWRTAYLDKSQQIFVDIETTKGETLMNGLYSTVKFPNEFAKSLTIAHNLLRGTDQKVSEAGFNYAKKAFELKPCRAAVIEIAYAARHPHLRKTATAYMQNWFNDFTENKDTYSTQGGYADKLMAATVAADFLSYYDRAKADYYKNIREQFVNEQKYLSARSKW